MSYVLHLIEAGEHQKQDFKMRVEDARKIARTLVAFANTDGGRLLIGVKDNGTVCGIDAEEELHMIQAAASMYCRPAIPFESQVWKAQLRTVLEINISRSAIRPHYAQHDDRSWQAYVRKADQNRRAHPVELKVWQYGLNPDRPEFHYDRDMGKLFFAWRKRASLPFGQVARKSRLSFEDTEDLLCLLIVWGVIEMDYGSRGPSYRLVDEAALDRLETEGNIPNLAP